jgi:ubiquinone/menaquinone biosynthesis C-methylase UbiE
MKFNLMERPDFYEFFSSGGVSLDDFEIEMVGNVKGKKLLDICCACDAEQAFSWANLGAHVTACDISPTAIEIAKENAARVGLDVEFFETDAQTLKPIPDNSCAIVYASYLCWYEDIDKACRTWHRVLKNGGIVFIKETHPFIECVGEESGRLEMVWNYFDKGPEYYSFDGTPLAKKHGGWESDLPVAEFFHTVSDIVNAAINAGFHLERMVETSSKKNKTRYKSGFPAEIALVCRK